MDNRTRLDLARRQVGAVLRPQETGYVVGWPTFARALGYRSQSSLYAVYTGSRVPMDKWWLNFSRRLERYLKESKNKMRKVACTSGGAAVE